MSLRFKRVCGKAGHHIKALYILSACLGLVIENPLWPRAPKTECRFPCSQIIHCLDRKDRTSCMVLQAVRPRGHPPLSQGSRRDEVPPRVVHVPVVCTRQVCADTYYRLLPNVFLLRAHFQMPTEQIRMLAAPFTQINSSWKDIIYEQFLTAYTFLLINC